MTRRVLLAMAVAAVVLVAGGVGWYQLRGEDELVRLRGDDPRILVYADDAQAPVGLGVEMPVVFDPDSRCLYVSDRQGDLLVAVWPAGSRSVFREGRRGVDVPRVGVVWEGDRIVDASISISAVNGETYLGPRLIELGECLSRGGSAVVFYDINEVRPADG